MHTVREFNMLLLLVAGGVLGLLLCGMLATTWYRSRRSGLGLVTVAVTLTPVGFMLIALRGFIPDTLSVVVGNLCFILALVYLGNGIRRLAGRSSEWLSALTLVAAAVLLLIYFTFVHNAVEMRVLGMSALIAVVCLANAFDARSLTAAGSGPRGLLVAAHTALVLLMLHRVRTAATGQPLEPLMQGGSSNVAGVVGALVFLILITTGVLWAVRRLEQANPARGAWEFAV